MPSTIWRGSLEFGLISLPVRLFRAARPDRLKLRHVASTNPPAEPEKRGRKATREDSTASFEQLQPIHLAATIDPPGERARVAPPLPSETVQKAWEVKPGRFVPIAKEELATLRVAPSDRIAIEEFVPLAEIDPIYFETSYYVVPEEAGEKAYALLTVALKEADLTALAQVAMHGREHVLLIRPARTGLVAHTMFYENEIHADEEWRADRSLVNKAEINLARQLLHSLVQPFEPGRYHDRYKQGLQQLIDAKVAAAPIAREEVPLQKTTAPVIDIADALRASLRALKKPAGQVQNSTRKHSAAH